MAKATVRIENKKDIFLRETSVENLFINEYLPSAPGDYVRVYLLGLMIAQNKESFDVERFARVLGMTTSEVEDAWTYWAKKGLIRKVRNDEAEHYEIEFVSLIDQLYARAYKHEPEKEEAPEQEVSEAPEETYDEYGETPAEKIVRLIDEGIREVYKEYERYTGRLLSSREMEYIADAIHVYDINPEVMSYAIKYCVELEKYNANYITKVALRWTSEGCRNIADIKAFLDKNSRRNADFGAVFRELGFNRLPSPAEREIIDGWLDRDGFTIEEIIDACRKTAGIREPSLKYVGKILENKMRETGGIATPAPKNYGSSSRQSDVETAKVSRAVLDEYYEYLRKQSEITQDTRIDNLCNKYPSFREVYDEENILNGKIVQLSFKPDAKMERAELKEKRMNLDRRKRELLIEIGYPADYLDRKYLCRHCKDTGMTNDGVLCACRKQRSEEAYRWKKEKTNN